MSELLKFVELVQNIEEEKQNQIQHWKEYALDYPDDVQNTLSSNLIDCATDYLRGLDMETEEKEIAKEIRSIAVHMLAVAELIEEKGNVVADIVK